MILLALLAAAGPSGATIVAGPERWLSGDDYPASALRAGEEGRVVVDVKVDAGGGVADCVVAVSSNSASLDAQTCRLFVERAHFSPARDRSGRAIAATVRQSIRWALPGEPIVARRSTQGSYVLERGRMVSCSEPGRGGGATAAGTDCEYQAGFLRAIVGDAYDRARKITVELIQTPGGALPPSPAGEHFVATEAVFTLGIGGRIRLCRVRTPSPDPAINLCEAAVATGRYEGKPDDTFTLSITASVE